MENPSNAASKEASAPADGPAMSEKQRNEAEFERNLLLLLRDYVSNSKTHPGHRLCPWEFREIKLLAHETTGLLIDKLSKSSATAATAYNEAAYDTVRKVLNCSHVEFEQFILLNQEQRTMWMTGIGKAEAQQLEAALNAAVVHYRTTILNTTAPGSKNPSRDKPPKSKRGGRKPARKAKNAPKPPQTPKPSKPQEETEASGRRSLSAEPNRSRGRGMQGGRGRGGRNQRMRSPVFTRSKQRSPNEQ